MCKDTNWCEGQKDRLFSEVQSIPSQRNEATNLGKGRKGQVDSHPARSTPSLLPSKNTVHSDTSCRAIDVLWWMVQDEKGSVSSMVQYLNEDANESPILCHIRELYFRTNDRTYTFWDNQKGCCCTWNSQELEAQATGRCAPSKAINVQSVEEWQVGVPKQDNGIQEKCLTQCLDPRLQNCHSLLRSI